MSTAVQGRRRLKVVCPHDCPDTCVMTVDVEGGKAVAIGGDPEHRFTRGFLCAKVNQYLDRVYSPDRVLHPLRRVGAKGEGRFARVSWDQALDEIAARRYVTKAMREVEFHAPVFLGDIVSFYTETVRVGRTSITVRVSVEAERWGGGRGETVKVTEAEVVLVAVDEGGHPIAIREES